MTSNALFWVFENGGSLQKNDIFKKTLDFGSIMINQNPKVWKWQDYQDGLPLKMTCLIPLSWF